MFWGAYTSCCAKLLQLNGRHDLAKEGITESERVFSDVFCFHCFCFHCSAFYVDMSSLPRGNARFSPHSVGRSQPTVTTIRLGDRRRGDFNGGAKKNSGNAKSKNSPPGGLIKVASASAIMVLFFALAGVVGGTWIGLSYILSPDSMAWLGPLLPQRRQVTDQDLLALDDIRGIANQYGLTLGEVTSLDEEHVLIQIGRASYRERV